MLWRNEPLPTHPNGMRFSVYDKEGTLLAVNSYYSVGGGFVVNERTQGRLRVALALHQASMADTLVLQSTRICIIEL